MEGITDLARFEALVASLEGAKSASQGLVDPQGRPLSAKTRPLSILECLDTPRIAFTRPDVARTYVVAPIVPTGKSTLVVGDSGIGKTPFLHQLGLCVAGGRTFLNMPVKQGPVLYIDWESSQEHSAGYQRQLSRFLGYQPDQDLPFYVHGAWSPWVNPQQDVLQRIMALAAAVKPVLVMFDCVRVLWPNAEKDNTSAQEMWKVHRALQETYGAATLAVHHLRKPAVDAKTGREVGVKLQTEPREWLRNAAGTGALLNTCESRIGVALYKGRLDRNKTIVLNGFAKSAGDYDALVAERVPGDDGLPIGYQVNVKLLREQLPEDFRKLLELLPQDFRNRDAVRLGETIELGETKVNTVLAALKQAQLVEQVGRTYRKLI
jgi:AAA domain